MTKVTKKSKNYENRKWKNDLSYRVFLIIYKIYILNVVAEPLTSSAPFLLLRAHCCRGFCLQKEMIKKGNRIRIKIQSKISRNKEN